MPAPATATSGGDPVALYETFATRHRAAAGRHAIYAGHDYLVNNLGFTLSREPGNAVAPQMKDRARADRRRWTCR